MSSIFSKIIKNEIPSFKILEDKNHLAFLDVFPLKKGHTLVIPKQEIDYIFDIERDEYLELWSFAKKISIAMKKVLKCKRIAVVVIGLEVPHAHIHLIPMDTVEEINFSLPKLNFSNIQMQDISELIKSAI
ncbi:MAG: HIT family protein [Flavobacteriales bacterium]|jgi:histidine triad (HIT) family protein|tara:strand:+ start:2128 stop:2520 length:393 start_codon:yes stop_codon:yes gene_type:complete